MGESKTTVFQHEGVCCCSFSWKCGGSRGVRDKRGARGAEKRRNALEKKTSVTDLRESSRLLMGIILRPSVALAVIRSSA